jgi:hypothetical protein
LADQVLELLQRLLKLIVISYFGRHPRLSCVGLSIDHIDVLLDSFRERRWEVPGGNKSPQIIDQRLWI